MDRLARPVVVPEIVRALPVHRLGAVVIGVVVLVLAVYVVLSPTQVADMAVKASVDRQMVARWVTQVSLENYRHHVSIKTTYAAKMALAAHLAHEVICPWGSSLLELLGEQRCLQW